MLSSITLAVISLCATVQAQQLQINSALHRSFYGMAYSPNGVILPDCGARQSDVTSDIFNLAQLTPRIRLYGSDCNQTALVLQGIQDAGDVDLTVWPGIYIPAPYNQTVVDRQVTAMMDAFQTYGTNHIGGVTVGNEYLLLSYGDSGTPTDRNGVAARTQLLSTIQAVNATLKASGYTFNVGTADAGSAATLELCEGVDYYMSNVHGWFGSVSAQQAAGWVWEFFQNFDVNVCAPAANKPEMFIAETGWPTASNDSAHATNGAGSPASIANLQVFLDTFVCQANANGTEYFFFEYMDEAWKAIYGGVETHWGLFDTSDKLKSGLTLPTCLVTSPTGGSAPTSNARTGSSNAKSGSERSVSLTWSALSGVVLLGLGFALVA